jgi:hypothetical protein
MTFAINRAGHPATAVDVKTERKAERCIRRLIDSNRNVLICLVIRSNNVIRRRWYL